MPRRCPKCGTENPAGFRFCGGCATPLAEPAAERTISAIEPALSAQTIPEQTGLDVSDGERKTVTALFADIKGSTELMRDLDPEEARALVDPALKLMIDAAHRYDGYVVQSTGDGIFALFGAPLAHEDHPQRALHAALAMRDALRRSGEELKKRGRSGVEVRIGINTGEVVLRMIHTGGHTEYTPVGHVANLAARMQSAAPAGGIVISENTRHLVEGYFELRELGPTEVKGIEEPINVYEVIGAGALRGHFELAARRGLTKFVGREREVAELKRALELARGGHGQIVAAVAEAGTGKSRLVYEFKALLPGDCKLLEAYSVSHGKASAYLPVLELLYRYFGIKETDDKAARRDKIEKRLSALDPALSDTRPLLYTLMGLHEGPDPLAQMDPQIKRRRILDAIKRIILRESLNQPLVVIFEDLHWIDSETQALLDLLADGIANARVLLLVNYRAEYRHEWSNKSYYAQLRLDALGRESAGAMLATLLGDSGELNPLKRMVVERTEGNPFFIEEMVQGLFDDGALIRNGEVKIVRPLAQLRLPPTVQGILASRIDRLSAEQKDLLQTLAVIGRESLLGLLGKVSRAEVQLERRANAWGAASGRVHLRAASHG
jgi:class 3 adenylate cyclase